MNKTVALLTSACLAVLGAGHAVAQDAASYPKKPIRIVVPFPAGGTSDVLARMVGQKLNAAWGQPVIVENRAGANGNIGADLVAKSEADGYTLLLMDVGNLAISPTLYPKLPFSPTTNLTPVSLLAYSPHLLVTYPGLPVQFPEDEKIWSGLRPLSPDGLPYIGRHSRFSNLSIAGGHAMLGLSLAAGTGKLMEEIISHKKPSIEISAFNAERFG